jgi:ElaB/YqjD/DUF883 family membrane-anchored ribosome-binding protein
MTQQRADYPLDYGATGAGAKDRVKELADTASDQLKAVADNAQEIAGKVSEQAREYVEKAQEYGGKAQEAAQQFKPFVEKSLRDQPMATLAAAALIGFVLGALWKK